MGNVTGKKNKKLTNKTVYFEFLFKICVFDYIYKRLILLII